ncbi:uncharacterized protein Z520_07818 [Fonsecaea multimorphosa CBS 102226]|uniref:Uncharacterized protein n=1 Tax=Fonsecaea multimorphosa CBS 102226 TaxID=1442371 RepID=A0A0D2JSW0_9EURO|nr:uncharacterized protein Z520_07818 [Fonsecaea multimorphosa CBS 102226]KIX96552.1 hypothetical protein Z520_07818 [Fonsecaea multimorphosa CBS 102226]OAL22165.1 hypothetical protein AYO22_07426 [Fonsecaea multimorphosa]
MLRTTLRSAAHDAAEWEAEDVTAILNEEAANSTRSSPRKRKRESRGGVHASSPLNKRIQIESPTQTASDAAVATTASPSRRKSGRLQARKSLSALTSVKPRDLFEIPDSPESKFVTKPSLDPIIKLRPLNKRIEQTESPFKGKGVLETRTNALVNLDDSPKKRPVRTRIEKIGRSLHKARRPASKLRETTTTTGQEPFDGEDIFEASQREDPADDLSDHGRRASQEGPSNKEVSSKASKKLLRSKTQLPAESSRDADPEIERNPQDPARSSNPLSEAANQTLANEITEPDVVDEVIEESGEEEVDNAANEEGQKEVDNPENEVGPLQQSQRPRTRAERDVAEQTAAEEEAKREQMVKDALSGIEIAAQVYACKDAWTESLVAAAEIAENRTSSGPESIKGRACAREFKKMVHIYKRIDRGKSGSPGRLEHEKQETLGLLKQRCKLICGFHHKPDMKFDLERKKMIQDIYEHLIPSSLELAKRALKALFQNDELSLTALEEICQLLNITSKLVKGARAWTPRPQLGNAVKRKTHSDIKPNVETIVENYDRAIDEDDQKRFVDELEVRQKQNLERLEAEHQRMKETRLAKYRQYRSHYNHDDAAIPAKSLSGSQRQFVDIDEILIDNEGDLADSQHRYETGHVNGSDAPTRPRLRREPTEDIPPPDETKWGEKELTVLVNALQKYTSESRWEDIIDTYGGPRGILEKYDMDQIMAKARWVKQTMARQLEDELDESWNWLRSVPG